MAVNPFQSQEWLRSNFPWSLTTIILHHTVKSKERPASHTCTLLWWQITILTTNSHYPSDVSRFTVVLFELWSGRVQNPHPIPPMRMHILGAVGGILKGMLFFSIEIPWYTDFNPAWQISPLTMFVQALAIIINLGLNLTHWVGPGWFPSSVATFWPLSDAQTWIRPSWEPDECVCESWPGSIGK